MLGAISRELQEVGQFHLPIDSVAGHFPCARIDVVHESVDRMKAGLRSFGRYVPRQLVRETSRPRDGKRDSAGKCAS